MSTLEDFSHCHWNAESAILATIHQHLEFLSSTRNREQRQIDLIRDKECAEQTLFFQIETNINWKIASGNLKPANCITIQKTKKIIAKHLEWGKKCEGQFKSKGLAENILRVQRRLPEPVPIHPYNSWANLTR